MNIEALNLNLLRSALDLASLRQQVIATNIANAGTPGYARQRLSFGDQLQAQWPGWSGEPRHAEPTHQRVEAAQVGPDLGADGLGRAVRLDEEVAEMALNSLHYQALMRALSRHFTILHSAATEGRR
ncbi:MAG: flagellar basal body rod protein FlgB [Burkholderiaceae bacterium]|nr:flagellar basal body rod protein FlgB [Burkholderiaceae bacterium]